VDAEAIQITADIGIDFLDQKQKNSRPRPAATVFLEKDGFYYFYFLIF
jgi:hypothetical protein